MKKPSIKLTIIMMTIAGIALITTLIIGNTDSANMQNGIENIKISAIFMLISGFIILTIPKLMLKLEKKEKLANNKINRNLKQSGKKTKN